jgi:hypothetical protein
LAWHELKYAGFTAGRSRALAKVLRRFDASKRRLFRNFDEADVKPLPVGG